MRVLLLAPAAVLLACSAPSTPDAGPDTSCGLDCAAQARFGLIAGRCFEYSSSPISKEDPPALGAFVKPVSQLEGGLKVMQVEYRTGGMFKMIDSFTIVNSELIHVRREFMGGGSGSVTWKKAGVITGVRWLASNSGPGENLVTDGDAVVSGAGGETTVATSFRMTTAAPLASDLRTPLMTYSEALRLLPGETPDHGADTRRVFVPDVGFVVIASAFSNIPGAASLPLLVQRIRDPGTPDGGAEDCSLGRP